MDEPIYELLFEESPLPKWVIDETTLCFLRVNHAAMELYGYSREEFLTITLADISRGQSAEDLRRRFATPAHGLHIGLVRHRTRDGREIQVDVVTRSLVYHGQSVRVAVITDMTERLQLAEAARQAEQIADQGRRMEAVGQLAGGIAHDFNNILTAIRGYSEIVRNALPVTHPVQPELFEILLSVDRAAALTRQLLAFSRRQAVRPDYLNLAPVIYDMETMLRRVLGERAELVIRIADTAQSVVADRSQIEQVIINLVTNARDAIDSAGVVLIRVDDANLDETFAAQHPGSVPGHYTSITVEDTGHGMRPEVRERAFEPFFTTRAVGAGSGLGLSTVYGIVKQSGGYITVDSSVGDGTRVQLWLPVAPEYSRDDESLSVELAALNGMPAGVSERRQHTALVAEDSAAVRTVVRRSLEANGYDVLEAEDGIAAIEMMRRTTNVDLVITDLRMPRMGGRKLITSLHELGYRPALLVMSAYSRGADQPQPELPPVAVFLEKPFTTTALLAAVERALEQHRLQGDLLVSRLHQEIP